MKTIILWLQCAILVHFSEICQSSDTILETHSTRRHRIKRSVRQRAFNRACRAHTCDNLKCNDEDGWYLYGSDWGCCGNYDGCCTWASAVCYFHDAMCKCCDYGWLICGPDCKPEAECFEGFEEKTNKLYSQINDKGSIEGHTDNKVKMNKKYETKKNIFSQIIHAKKIQNSVLPLKKDDSLSKSNLYELKERSRKRTKYGDFLKKYNVSDVKGTYGTTYKKQLKKMFYHEEQLMAADQPLHEILEDGSGEIP